MVWWAPEVGQDFLIESPSLYTLTTPAVSPSVVGPLTTLGNQIIQANGQPITLRGLVLPGLEQSGTLAGTGVSEQAVIEAKEWGANVVRVPLGEQFWLSSNCDYVPTYEATVDQVVNWITSLGMVALLDLHTNTVSGCETGSQHNMADEAQSPTFWSQVAERYGNPLSPEYSPLVAFDLYNEPHDISQSIWLNGGETTDTVTGVTYDAAGMQQLYDSGPRRGVHQPHVHQRPQLGQHASDDPGHGPRHRLCSALLHVPVGGAAQLHEHRPLRPHPGPEPVDHPWSLRACHGDRVRMALPRRWYVRLQRDRLRERTGMGLECLRLGGCSIRLSGT